MLVLYNMLHLACIPFLLPLIAVEMLIRPEKRRIIPGRLGLGVQLPFSRITTEKVVWVHALSVGEVSSALPLIKQLSEDRTDVRIVFSATTASGLQLAEEQAAPYASAILPFPFDLWPVVNRVIALVKPDLFILVETDFWPNILSRLNDSGVPALLVNGRISNKSIKSYLRFRRFSIFLFNQFSQLCMQSQNDVDNMRRLGISPDKLVRIGNLKCAPPDVALTTNAVPLRKITAKKHIWLCGSTHAGEEDIILRVYGKLIKTYDLQLVIAPRQVRRSTELIGLAAQHGFTAAPYSHPGSSCPEVIIVDTIGDLPALYGDCSIAYIGGSLVPEGGHNPLEAARFARPILFGPYMDDFPEISSALLDRSGARIVKNEGDLWAAVKLFLDSEQERNHAGNQARSYIDNQRQVIASHIEIINTLL